MVEYTSVSFLNNFMVGHSSRVTDKEARISREGDTVSIEYLKTDADGSFRVLEVPRSVCLLERRGKVAKQEKSK